MESCTFLAYDLVVVVKRAVTVIGRTTVVDILTPLAPGAPWRARIKAAIGLSSSSESSSTNCADAPLAERAVAKAACAVGGPEPLIPPNSNPPKIIRARLVEFLFRFAKMDIITSERQLSGEFIVFYRVCSC